MGLKDKLNQIKNKGGNFQPEVKKQRGLEIKLPGCDEFVPLGFWQYNKVYTEGINPHLTIIIDEVGELLQVEGGRSAEAKETAQLQAEIETCIKSITQLGRVSGIAMILATQRNDASVIAGSIQNNPLALDTKIEVLRPIDDNEVINETDIEELVIKESFDYEGLKRVADQLGVPYDENGIIYENEEEKIELFRQIEEDARLYDIERIGQERVDKGEKVSILQEAINNRRTNEKQELKAI